MCTTFFPSPWPELGSHWMLGSTNPLRCTTGKNTTNGDVQIHTSLKAVVWRSRHAFSNMVSWVWEKTNAQCVRSSFMGAQIESVKSAVFPEADPADRDDSYLKSSFFDDESLVRMEVNWKLPKSRNMQEIDLLVLVASCFVPNPSSVIYITPHISRCRAIIKVGIWHLV